jgi:two-component system response regulator YesN
MMHRVVVVDDKPIIRRALVQTIGWDALRCEVVGQAEDGLQARSVIASTKPDIVITDIKMPGLTGLELAEWMNAAHPLTKTILITGYQDFEYAQQAVKLKAFDFILKPVRNEELQKAVRTAVCELEKDRQELVRRESMEQRADQLAAWRHQSIPDLQSKLLEDLLSRRCREQSEAESRAMELSMLSVRYSLVMIRNLATQGNAGGDSTSLSKRDSTSLLKKDSTSLSQGESSPATCFDLLSEEAVAIAQRCGFQIVSTRREQELLLVCLFPKVTAWRETRVKLQQFCSKLHQHADEGGYCSVRLASSETMKSLIELPQAYQAVNRLMEGAFFRDAKILFPEENVPSKAAGQFSIMHALESLQPMMENQSNEEMLEHLSGLAEQIEVFSGGNILVVKGLISEICLGAARYYFRKTGDEFGLDKSVDRMMEEIFQLTSMREASRYLFEIISSIKQKLEQGSTYSLHVKKIVDYINRHYADNVSLSTVAEHFGLSSSYLSRLVRSETGVNFVDLLTKARIESAKRLLKDSKHKVNEVGEMVGYKEYAYFYQVFKRFEGVSPKDYKNKSLE